MQQAHSRLLAPGGTGFHNGADHDFDQTAAHGVEHHRQKDAAVAEGIWRDSQRCQAAGREQMRCDDADTVADAVDELRGNQIHQELDREIHRGDQGDPIQGQAELSGKGEKQQRREIIHNGLGDIAEIAGVQGVIVAEFHAQAPNRCFSHHTMTGGGLQEKSPPVPRGRRINVFLI